MDPEHPFTEGGDLPDTIPVALIQAHGAAARRTVARSTRPTTSERLATWELRLAKAAMVVAVVAILAALSLLVVALPILGIPLAAVAVAVGATSVGAWLVKRRSR